MTQSTEFRAACLLGLFLLLQTASGGAAASLKPFKDELFSYGTVLESADGGDFRVVDYDEMRDINGRDEIPERRAKRTYVDLSVKRQQANETIEAEGRAIEVFRAGRSDSAAFTIIFIHGRAGDRRLGANDYSFGGNFNRLKNLAIRNNGTYYAPTVRSFDEQGSADVAALVRHASATSGGAPVVLACASMGSSMCWSLARDPQAVAALDGFIVLGGTPDADYAATAAGKAKLPLYLAHGSADSVYAAEGQAEVYRRLKAKAFPARLVVFRTGSHGTPVRMIDWREAIDWILDR